MRFTKMQAAGNDYVYMDTLKAPISSPEALARRISDRHFGVGSDGLILICPPSDPGEADFRERIHPKKDFSLEDPDFSPQPYYQDFQERLGFLTNLSIFYLLFNMGPESLLVLQQSNKPEHR